MKEVFYDLHLHSCLSPCGDDEMTANGIAGMAKLNGIDIAALTDHNSAKNCPAFFEACRSYGVVPVAGMELTTAEDIHLVCLFETLEAALEFDRALQAHRILIRNKPQAAGEQNIVDAQDNIIGVEEYFLPNATDLSLEKAAEFARSYGAVVYPAHVDRQANGVIAVLGVFPNEPEFAFAEFHGKDNLLEYRAKYPDIKRAVPIVSSDAHYLWDMNERVHSLFLDTDGEDEASIRQSLFRRLKEPQQR